MVQQDCISKDFWARRNAGPSHGNFVPQMMKALQMDQTCLS